MTTPVRVTLTAMLPKDGSTLRLDLVGDDRLSGGVATWSTLNRPRRRDAVEFTGVRAFTYVLPLLLNGMEYTPGSDTSVEADISTLLDWAGTVKKSSKQTTVLKATGPLQTSDALRWVITDLEWGPKVRNGAGQRVQQYVTVTLTEYRAAIVRKDPAKRARDRKGK